MSRRMLVVAARGGTVLREIADGGTARVVIVTNDMHADLRDGSGAVYHLGPVETARLRRAESQAAAEAAGASVTFLDFQTSWYWDAGEKVPLDWRDYGSLPELPGEGSVAAILAGGGWRRVEEAIGDIDPDVIFTHPVSGYDQAGLYAAHAVFYCNRRAQVYLWQAEAGRAITELETDVVVDITAFAERKREIIGLHASQLDEGRLESARLREELWGRALTRGRLPEGLAGEAFTLSRYGKEGLI